jgi:WD40 repeat protein
MATGDERGRVAIYDAATRLAVTPPYEIRDGLIQDVRFSPDSKTLALSFIHRNDAAPQGIVDLLDARTGRRRLRVQLPPASAPGGFVFADVVFLPDGRDLLVRQVAGASPVGPASPMYRVDGTTGAVTGRLTVGRSATSFNASATADRRRVFVTSAGDDRTWELDPKVMLVVRSWPAGDASGAVSPDGRSFALGGLDGRVRLLDLATGRVRRLPGGHRGRVLRMRFTPDGRTLVTAGIDGRVLAWSLAGDHRVRLVGRHSKEIDGLDLSRDGRTLLTASLDGRAILWDLAGDRRLDRRFAAGPRFPVAFTPRGIAVSPDGRTLAVTQADGDVVLIDTRTLQRRASIHALRGPAAAAAFSPDGKVLAVTGAGGRLTLWNTRTLAPAGELRGMRADSEAVAFSPDGRRVAAAEAIVSAAAFRGPPQPLRVWDLRRRAPTALRARMSANLIAYSPGGRLIAGATLQHGAEVRDARTGRLVARPGATGEGVFSRSVAFSPDGRLLFVGLFDGTGHLFATDSWKPVGQALKAHTARVTFASFTPDARTLVTAAADGTVILWDVATQSPIGPPLRLAHNTFASVALSPDGSHLYAVSTRGEGISLDLRPAAWKRHACQVAGRELTAAEWRDALPRRPYRAVCSGR